MWCYFCTLKGLKLWLWKELAALIMTFYVLCFARWGLKVPLLLKLSQNQERQPDEVHAWHFWGHSTYQKISLPTSPPNTSLYDRLVCTCLQRTTAQQVQIKMKTGLSNVGGEAEGVGGWQAGRHKGGRRRRRRVGVRWPASNTNRRKKQNLFKRCDHKGLGKFRLSNAPRRWQKRQARLGTQEWRETLGIPGWSTSTLVQLILCLYLKR